MGFCASRERKAQHSPTLPQLLSLASVCTNEHARDSFTGPRGAFSRLRCRPSFSARVQNKRPPLIGNVLPRRVGRAPCETALMLRLYGAGRYKICSTRVVKSVMLFGIPTPTYKSHDLKMNGQMSLTCSQEFPTAQMQYIRCLWLCPTLTCSVRKPFGVRKVVVFNK